MITIQELHKYGELVDQGFLPPIPCPMNVEHMSPIPFVKDDEPVMWCLECDTKLHLGERKVTLIKKLIGNV
jgi:hypothetical protein